MVGGNVFSPYSLWVIANTYYILICVSYYSKGVLHGLSPPLSNWPKFTQQYNLMSLILSNGRWYGLNACVLLPHEYVEALTPNVMVLGGGAFGRCLDLNKDIRVDPL